MVLPQTVLVPLYMPMNHCFGARLPDTLSRLPGYQNGMGCGVGTTNPKLCSGEFEDRPDFGGQKPRGEGLATKKKRELAAVGGRKIRLYVILSIKCQTPFCVLYVLHIRVSDTLYST